MVICWVEAFILEGLFAVLIPSWTPEYSYGQWRLFIYTEKLKEVNWSLSYQQGSRHHTSAEGKCVVSANKHILKLKAQLQVALKSRWLYRVPSPPGAESHTFHSTIPFEAVCSIWPNTHSKYKAHIKKKKKKKDINVCVCACRCLLLITVINVLGSKSQIAL